MAGMKRFVTYIYSYEDGIKGNNVGFAKIEIRGEECRIEIHLRGVYIGTADCSVYLFHREQGELEGIPLGKMKLARGMGDFGIRVRAGKVADSPYGISQLEGIFLLGEDGSIFMSRWTEGEPFAVAREYFREWNAQSAQPETAKEQEDVQQKPVESAVTAGETQEETQEEKPEPPVVDIPAQECGEEARTPIVATEVAAMKVPARNVFPDYHWPEIWERMQQKHETVQPFVNKEVSCIQIELKELRELPQRYWYLGNNSFLLHGYFNYQYLVLGREGTGANARWFLGIPGIYQRQERVMAAIFGFPEFLAVAAGAGEEVDINAEPVNRFGCWLRYIEE